MISRNLHEVKYNSSNCHMFRFKRDKILLHRPIVL
jgi:hypothetical protein